MQSLDMEEPLHKKSTNSDKVSFRKDMLRCYEIPASPHPMYIANVFSFLVAVVNHVAFDAMLYNKLCYARYSNNTLCSNTTFTKNHPDLQVSVGFVTYM